VTPATLAPMRQTPRARAADLAEALEEAQQREVRLREVLERVAGHAAAMQADAAAASPEQLGFSYIRALSMRALEVTK